MDSEQDPEETLFEHVDETLFDGTLDDFDNHIQRKRAVAHPLRYALLFYLYERDENVPRHEIVEATGREGNALQHHLTPLLENHLISEIPAPGDDNRRTAYRLTTFGQQEIEADYRNIHGTLDP